MDLKKKMEYKKLIIEALDRDDWFEVMNIAEKARKEFFEESYFGMRKGFFNIIHTNSLNYAFKVREDLEKHLNTMNIDYHSGNYVQILKKINKGVITNNTCLNNYTVLLTNSDTLKSKLSEINLPSIEFRAYEKTNRYDWKLMLENLETKQIFELNDATCKGILREKQLISILDD